MSIPIAQNHPRTVNHPRMHVVDRALPRDRQNSSATVTVTSDPPKPTPSKEPTGIPLSASASKPRDKTHDNNLQLKSLVTKDVSQEKKGKTPLPSSTGISSQVSVPIGNKVQLPVSISLPRQISGQTLLGTGYPPFMMPLPKSMQAMGSSKTLSSSKNRRKPIAPGDRFSGVNSMPPAISLPSYYNKLPAPAANPKARFIPLKPMPSDGTEDASKIDVDVSEYKPIAPFSGIRRDPEPKVIQDMEALRRQEEERLAVSGTRIAPKKGGHPGEDAVESKKSHLPRRNLKNESKKTTTTQGDGDSTAEKKRTVVSTDSFPAKSADPLHDGKRGNTSRGVVEKQSPTLISQDKSSSSESSDRMKEANSLKEV